MSQYKSHVDAWSDCTDCSLCKTRKKVVLARGTLPCNVLFIGEAPGKSEDIIGQPFVGPAGHLLNKMIDDAKGRAGVAVSTAYTNLIGCIPFDEDRTKVGEPPEYAVRACESRLRELVDMANPSIIVTVGKSAEHWITEMFGNDHAEEFVSIMHPAHILRLDVSQKGLAIQRTVVTLSECFSELVPF